MTHLTKRNGVYYFRRKIPLELRAYFDGKAEITFSLQTKNRSEAEPLARKWSVAYDEEFAKARRNALEAMNADSGTLPIPVPKPSITDDLTIDDFDILVSRYIHRLRARRELAAASKKYEQFRQYLSDEIVNLTEFLEDGEHPFDNRQRPIWHVEAQLKALKAILEGNAPQSVGLHTAYSPQPAPLQTQAPATAALTTFDSLLSRWASERQPEARTVTQYKRVIQKLQDHTNVTLVEKLTKQHVVIYKDKLIAEGTTTVTANNYLSNLTTLLNYAISNALIESNPAASIRVLVRDEDKKEREPFSVQQLNTLFSSPVYSSGLRPTGGKGDAAYWLPLLGLFSGARLNELCQLNKVDIRQEQYHDEDEQVRPCWVMDITDSGDDQKLKNAKSKRRIPIHSTLLALGFIEFVERSPGPKVFHELKPSEAYGSISASWSKWFARYLKQIGLKSDSLVFHSFRHSFKYYARLCSIPDKLQYALQGHSGGNVGDEYGGSAYPLAPLVRAMERYSIPHLLLPARVSS